jgi:UDP-N-acetylmuramoyl-tripeptide--D-alanyl-D-alanine ligase
MDKLKVALRQLVARRLEQRVRRLIRERRLKVVAVTGSVGKTSTKLAIATVLSRKYRVLAQRGNFNSEIGLPLSIFELDVPATLTSPLAWFKILRRIDARLAGDYPYDVLVLEMGADQMGDIQKFMRYIHPDVGIVTAIAPVHIEQLGSVEAIAREKMALARGSRAVLLNAEDERVMVEAATLGVPVQTYGVAKGGVRFAELRRAKNETLGGTLMLNDGEIKVQTQYVGRHSLAALAAAAAVAEELGLTPEEIEPGVEAAEPFAGRMRVMAGIDGATVIDDSYNASPPAVIAALQTLAELPGRHIAILGTMNELGDYAERGHREAGAAASQVDELVTIGDIAKKYLVAGAVASGLSPKRIHSFDSPYAAGNYVRSIIKKDDTVLVKGSQNKVFAEEATALLLADPAERSQLVRQGPSWQAKKRVQFSDAPA